MLVRNSFGAPRIILAEANIYDPHKYWLLLLFSVQTSTVASSSRSTLGKVLVLALCVHCPPAVLVGRNQSRDSPWSIDQGKYRPQYYRSKRSIKVSAGLTLLRRAAFRRKAEWVRTVDIRPAMASTWPTLASKHYGVIVEKAIPCATNMLSTACHHLQHHYSIYPSAKPALKLTILAPACTYINTIRLHVLLNSP